MFYPYQLSKIMFRFWLYTQNKIRSLIILPLNYLPRQLVQNSMGASLLLASKFKDFPKALFFFCLLLIIHPSISCMILLISSLNNCSRATISAISAFSFWMSTFSRVSFCST